MTDNKCCPPKENKQTKTLTPKSCLSLKLKHFKKTFKKKNP